MHLLRQRWQYDSGSLGARCCLPCNEMRCQARFVMQDTSLPTPETFPFLLSQSPVAFLHIPSHPGFPCIGTRHYEGDGGVGTWAGLEPSPPQ